MKKSCINLNDFTDLIARFNPLGFKTPEGRPRIFKNYTQIYLYTMRELEKKFPEGYIDLPLFLSEQLQISLKDAVSEVRQWQGMGIRDEEMRIDMRNKGAERNNALKMLMRALHKVASTTFDNECFEEAIENYDELT